MAILKTTARRQHLACKNRVQGIIGISHVDLAQSINGTTSHEILIENSKPRISLDVGQRIQPRHNLLEHGNLLSLGTRPFELSKPDWSTSDCVGFLDICLEVIRIGGAVIPVYRHEIDGATSARIEELSEPCQAHWRTAVGDSWSSELDFSG